MGAGFKDFASGAILTAGDVDNYLMRQTVMTFADASARDTALSGVLDEGMITYLEDVNALTVYNGSAWVAVIDSDVLTVDTSNNRVGINDSTPSYALDVTGDINASGALRIGGTAVGEATAFTPSWTNFTPGNATESWYYVVVNDLLIVQGRTVLGSTSVVGSLPLMDFPVGTQVAPSATICGSTIYEDAAAALYIGFVDIDSSKFRFWVNKADATYVKREFVGSTVPMTWTTADSLWMTATAFIS